MTSVNQEIRLLVIVYQVGDMFSYIQVHVIMFINVCKIQPFH